MGMCKGNRGNLMQHWTLIECLFHLQSRFKALHFVTTHSMAPWAFPNSEDNAGLCRSVFVRAGARLATIGTPCRFELAWKRLSVANGFPYPSSAVFAAEEWKGSLSIVVCEADLRTADEIEGWLALPQQQSRFQHSVLLRGDWRSSLSNPLFLRTPTECIFIEMDPMRYDTRVEADRNSTDPASLYPDDVDLLVQSLAKSEVPVVLQISSFSNQRNFMPLDSQRESLVSVLQTGGFSLCAEVRVMQHMASFVFTRGCQLPVAALGDSFNDWVGGIE
jgi:hypothetical protein